MITAYCPLCSRAVALQNGEDEVCPVCSSPLVTEGSESSARSAPARMVEAEEWRKSRPARA